MATNTLYRVSHLLLVSWSLFGGCRNLVHKIMKTFPPFLKRCWWNTCNMLSIDVFRRRHKWHQEQAQLQQHGGIATWRLTVKHVTFHLCTPGHYNCSYSRPHSSSTLHTLAGPKNLSCHSLLNYLEIFLKIKFKMLSSGIQYRAARQIYIYIGHIA